MKITCKNCKKEELHHAKGLCLSCYVMSIRKSKDYRKYQKGYRERNKKQGKEYARSYYLKNKEKLQEYGRRNYYKKKSER